MTTASESAPTCGEHEREAAAWLDNISFCNDFCQWVDEEFSIDSLPADSQQPVESTRASAAASAQSPAEIPTGGNRRGRIHAFFKRAWKAIKKPFLRSRRTRVESPAPHQSDPEPASVPGPAGLQNVPDTDPAVPEPASVPGLPDCEPATKSLYNLYILQDLIGKGSFGKVFKAIRKSDGRKVAIKRLCKWNNGSCLQIPGCSRPLPREVALMLMLRRPPVSPNVIQMYEWFDQPQIFSLILEYPQPCVVLRKFISVSSGLIEPIACSLMRQLVLAVQHCIDHGVFHNDIHADNILVNTDTLKLKLIDFGAGHLLNNDGYDSWTYLGAVEYCPPEALSEPKYYAIPTNVWALGIVLYIMVNRKLPFCHVRETLKACPNSWKPTVSIACRDLIGRCLNRNQEKRPTLKQILRHQWFKRWHKTEGRRGIPSLSYLGQT